MAERKPDQFTLETFAELVGDRFKVAPADGDEPFDVVLTSAEKAVFEAHEVPDEARKRDPADTGDAADHKPRREPFSLLFHADGHELVGQQTFTVNHGKLGEFSMFMVPHGADPRGMMYGAEWS